VNVVAPVSAALLAKLTAGDEALDRGARSPKTELDLLRATDLLRAPFLPIDGGKGWGTTAEGALPIFDILYALGGASLPIARIYEGHVNAVRLVTDYGTLDQRSHFADRVMGGTIAGVWGADSERAVMIEGSALYGVKAFASGLGDVGIAILTAKTDEGLQMVLADVTDAARFDHQSWDVTAMVGSRSGRFDCDGLTLTSTMRIGDPDSMFEEPAFHGGIWRILACYAGAMAEMAGLAHAMVEGQGKSDDSLIRHRVGEIAMESHAALALARCSCLAAESGQSFVSPIADVLFAREAIEQSALRQISMIERLAGTSLHQAGSQLGRIARNLRLYLRQAHLDGKLAYATAIWTAEQ
jgi:hypothetical protein